ncbi:MAG: hypothetical protein LQ340_003022 [Diploschistes diacapsis]|nr:MAG: hypothetical protein LQ340_003022 [Diploschistes diacapsis]
MSNQGYYNQSPQYPQQAYGGGYQQQGHGAPHQNYGPPQQGGYYNQGYNQGPPVRFNEAHGRQRVGEGWKY